MSADRAPNHDAVIEFLRNELMRAPSYQGGHSDEGRRIAGRLGVPFPLNMDALKKRAIHLDLNPAELWPWLASLNKSK